MLELREAICEKLDRENGYLTSLKIFSCRMEKNKVYTMHARRYLILMKV